MEMIIDIILELVLGLLTDGGVEVMTGSESAKKWPKPLKIICVVSTLLLAIAVIGFLLIYGIVLEVKGNVIGGAYLLVAGATLLILAIVMLRKGYKSYKNKMQPRGTQKGGSENE